MVGKSAIRPLSCPLSSPFKGLDPGTEPTDGSQPGIALLHAERVTGGPRVRPASPVPSAQRRRTHAAMPCPTPR